MATFKAEVARLTGIATAIQSARDSAISQAMATGQRAIAAGANPEAVTAMVGDTADAVNGLILSTDQSAEAQFRNKLAVEASLGGLQEYTTGLEDANRAATKLASGGLSDMDAKFNDLKGKVSGVLGRR
ncbi:MAG: hypothetical protein IPM07_26310 [Anaerolineales bacterium]|nr:hypothetical protein [Anaerolineales bacterium]